MQLLEVGAGVDPELVDKQPTTFLVGGERVGLATRAIERKQQLAAQPLPQRVLTGQSLELRYERSVAAAREVSLDPLLDAREP